MVVIKKVQVFSEELGWIADPKIRAFAKALIQRAPDYFFEVASSSTGKFHPPYALGSGGLVRHTKAATMIMHELFSLEMFGKYSQNQKDMMLVSMIAHDFFKHGLEAQAGKYTVAEHPLVCADFIKNDAELCAMLEPEQIDFIYACIASHMGQWNTDYRSRREILPKPKTGSQNFVHLCDYLASRKYLIFDFGDDYYEPEPEEPEPQSNPQDDKLAELKAKIVTLCKEKIAAGVENKAIYAVVAAENEGSRNPNSISDLTIAETILHRLEEL